MEGAEEAEKKKTQMNILYFVPSRLGCVFESAP